MIESNQPRRILIATPTLGTRQSLAETIASVDRFRRQVRHVVICPSDRVIAVQQLVGADREIVVEDGKSGVYGAVNKVLLNPELDCDWVGYINDDDYWLESMGELIRRAQTTRNDILYGRVEFIDITGNHLAYSSSTAHFKLFPYLAAHGAYLITQQAVLIRRRLFERLGGFDTKYRIQADNDFWIRAIRDDAKCEYVNRVCGAYRMHDQQLSADQYGLKERAEMLANHGISSAALSTRLALLLYRMLNVSTYVMRLARGNRSIRAEAGRPTNSTL